MQLILILSKFKEMVKITNVELPRYAPHGSLCPLWSYKWLVIAIIKLALVIMIIIC